MHLGRVILIVFLICCAASIGLGLWLRITGFDIARENQSILGLRTIHEKSLRWAAERGGTYPDHPARLLTWVSVRPLDFRDPREPADSVWTIGEVDVLSLTLAGKETPDIAADRATLDEAIARMPPASFIRFGDYFFTRLEKPTREARLVFGWTLPGENGRRFVLHDHGDARRIEAAEWAAVWQSDAEARAELGLPVIEPPAFTADE